MKTGDLVKISCTCGKAHDKEPLIGVVVGEDDNTKKVEILRKYFISVKILNFFQSSVFTEFKIENRCTT